jgi:hypothetical protein
MNRYSTGKFTGQYKARLAPAFDERDHRYRHVYGQRLLRDLANLGYGGTGAVSEFGSGDFTAVPTVPYCVTILPIRTVSIILNHWRKGLDQVGGVVGAWQG